MDNSKKIAWAIIGVVVIVLIIYGVMATRKNNVPASQTQSNSQTPNTLQPAPNQTGQVPASAVKMLTVALNTQNNSGESGTATLTEENGKTKVVLNYTGFPQDVVQPAHIHTGSCASLGGIKYALSFPKNGTSETTLDVSIDQLLAQLPLAINVHKSASEVTVYTACGDITNTNASVPSPALTTQPTMTQPKVTTPTPTPVQQPSSGGYGY